MYYIPRKDYRRLQDRAYRAQQKNHLEVCGITVVNASGRVRLIFIPNETNEPLTFKFGNRSIREAKKQIRKGEKIFSTFHSHPLAEAVPSKTDIKIGFYFRKAIIYDVCGKHVRLWYKIKTKAKELPIKVKWLP